MEFSLENMCRACMNEEGSMFSVYGKDKSLEININYSEMIMNVASVQIENEDDLPKQICQYCLKQLILAYTFKETIERSDATLREITKNPEIEFIKEEVIDDNDENPEIEFIKHEVMDDDDDDDNNDDYSEIDQDEEQQSNSFEAESNRKSSDFKLTAEFLDDDFHVAEDENDFTPTDELDTMLKSVNNKNSFMPSIEQLKQSVLKPKSPRKLTNRNNDCDEYRPTMQTTKLLKPTKQYVCPLCSKRFAKYDTFKKHKKLHITLKCKLCEKEFRSTHGLRYHMNVHSGVKNYACTFANCEKKFRLKQALDKHLSIHNNEKNHLCPICGKTYAQYDALHYHIRNHTGERPYLCVHCGKTFKQSCHLKNHMWNHTGIKPHKCKSCGKCYTTGHQLKKHLRKYCNNPENQNTINTVNTMKGTVVDDIIHIKIEEEHILEITEHHEEETENGPKIIYLK